MKKLSMLILAAGMIATPAAEIYAAEDGADGFSAYTELDAVSKYVWRGLPLSDNEAYQPSVTFSQYGFTGNIWLNYSVEQPRHNKVSELDYALSYERELLGVAVSPGFVLYTYPEADSYGDGYVKLSWPVAFLKIFTDQYLSVICVDIAGGYYGDAGLGYEKQFAGGAIWSSSALLGWGSSKFNSFNYAAEGLASQLNILVIDTAVTVKLSEKGSLRPHLTYSATLPGGFRDALKAADYKADNLVVGLAAGYKF